VATMVVSRWEGELDKDRMSQVLNKETEAEAEEPEAILEGIPVPNEQAAAEQA
jgi:aerobic C4-dicarboxylate transport protein